MDRTSDGRVIDVILNSDAVIARKNISQIPEVYLSMIADKIKTIIQDKSLEEVREILNKYKLSNYSKLSDEELTKVIESRKPLNYITGCFSKITADEILRWFDQLGMDSLTQLIDGKTKRPIKNKILVGNMYMMKLYQLPDYANKVHSDSSTEDPILGSGFFREGSGQSQGGLETFALLGSDLEPMIHATRRSTELEDAKGILINLRLAGVNLKID